MDGNNAQERVPYLTQRSRPELALHHPRAARPVGLQTMRILLACATYGYPVPPFLGPFYNYILNAPHENDGGGYSAPVGPIVRHSLERQDRTHVQLQTDPSMGQQQQHDEGLGTPVQHVVVAEDMAGDGDTAAAGQHEDQHAHDGESADMVRDEDTAAAGQHDDQQADTEAAVDVQHTNVSHPAHRYPIRPHALTCAVPTADLSRDDHATASSRAYPATPVLHLQRRHHGWDDCRPAVE